MTSKHYRQALIDKIETSVTQSNVMVGLVKTAYLSSGSGQPLIFLHGAGVVFWSIAGYITQDKPVLANFGLQIPLFAIGFSKVLFGF